MSDWISVLLIIFGLLAISAVGNWSSRRTESNITYLITSAGIVAGLILIGAGFLGILANASF